MSDVRFNQWLHQSGTGGVSQVSGGHVGIGTTNPEIAVHSGNTKVLNVGIVTASTYYGNGANLTGLSGGGTGLDLNDNIKVRLGNSQDLQLYHDGSHSYIDDAGTGNLRLRSGTLEITNAAGSKTSAVFNSGSSQDLYFNNTKRFETTNTGAKVTGTLAGASEVGIQSGGVQIGAGITQLNFVGTGNTFAVNGTTVDISIQGGGGGTGAGGTWSTYTAGIATTKSVGVNTSTLDDNDLVGVGNSFQGLYISNGMMIMDNKLSGNHYIGTAFNGLMAGPVTVEGTLTIDGNYVVV